MAEQGGTAQADPAGSPASDTPGLAAAILAAVGGPGNVVSVEHCTTRLRFVLADQALANRQAITDLPRVMSLVERGGQWQVVIGADVPQVYDAIAASPGLGEQAVAGARRNLVDQLFDLLTGTFGPLIQAMVGAAMVKTGLSLAVRFGGLSTESTAFAIWAAAGNSVFFFLPVLVGITSARKLGANPYVGAAIGGALLEANYTGLGPVGTREQVLGLPLLVVDYGQSVFPTVFAVAALGVMERWLRARLPKDLHLVVIPGLCLAVLVPLTFLVFGPIGLYLGEALADLITTLNEASPMLTGAVFAASFMFLVMLGLHWALVPVMLSGITSNGQDPLLAYMGAYNFAVFGLALGVFLRTREPALRQLSGSGVVSGLLAGISEPVVYGIILRFKRTVPIMMVAAATGGAVQGALQVNGTVIVFNSVFTIPSFDPTVGYLLGVGTSFLLGLMLVVAFGYKPRRAGIAPPAVTSANIAVPPPNAPEPAPAGPAEPPAEPAPHASAVAPTLAATGGLTAIGAPLAGDVMALSAVADPVFAGGLLGPGVAIRPDPAATGVVVSPVAGRVTSVARGGHAIGVTSDSGLDILIHVGIDTVGLGGGYFTPLVRSGTQVSPGTPLLGFDAAAITAAGLELTTPIVVANAAAFGPVTATTRSSVAAGELLLVVGQGSP